LICKCACIERKRKIDRNVRVERVRKRGTHSAGVDIVEGNREKEETIEDDSCKLSLNQIKRGIYI
jgi:hypothetical protein